DVLVSGLLLADLMFYQWFDELVPFRMASEASQVSGVGESTLSTFSPVQLLLFSDLVVLAVLALVLRGRIVTPVLRAPRSWTSAGVALVVSLAVLVAGGFDAGTRSLRERYSTAALSRSVGPVPYHLYDLAWSAAGPGEPKAKPADLVHWEQARRAADVHTELSGAAKGSNLLIIQMEAMENILIGRSVNGQEVTPTMNRLVAGNALYFDHYHTQIGVGNTSDAELMSLTSLHPIAGGSAYLLRSHQDYPGSLPNVLRSAGFSTAEAFHGYDRSYYNRWHMYPHLGFTGFHLGGDFDRTDKVGMGISDESFFSQTADKLKGVQGRWFGFVISLSGHHPYRLPAQLRPLDIPDGTYSKEFTAYLQAQAYADRALGHFLDRLRADGTLANTTLAIYGDHWGFGWPTSDTEKFVGRHGSDAVDHADDTRVPLVIALPEGHKPGKSRLMPVTGGEIDLTPTLLDLFGIAPTGFYFGRSLLAGPDLVAQRHYSPLGSYMDSDHVFRASADGNLEGGQCVEYRTRKVVPVADCKKGYDETRWRIQMSDSVIDGNLLPQLIADERTLNLKASGTPTG
ncbi:MAG: LTA synthase family protein, partial [Marmoricola sp.]